MATKKKPSEYDPSDFDVMQGVSLLDTAPNSPVRSSPTMKQHSQTAPAVVQPTPHAAPTAPVTPSPMPASAMQNPAMSARAAEPERPPVFAPAPNAQASLFMGRAHRVALTFWVTPDLRRAIRHAMIGRFEGVYRSQGDLIEAAVWQFLHPQ